MHNSDQHDQFFHEGYLVIRNVLNHEEVKELQDCASQIWNDYRELSEDSFFGNCFIQLLRACNPFDSNINQAAPIKGKIRRVTYPYAFFPTLDRYRTHANIISIVRTILGENIVQIVNQLNYNSPKEGTGWGWHQDYRFRKEGLTDLPKSYVQTVIAIDPMSEENGGIRLIPKSQNIGPLKLDIEQENAESQFDATKTVTPQLNPGDLLAFGPYMIHGSTPNNSEFTRRVFINGYANANFCDYGMPVLMNGKVIKKAQGIMEYESQESLVAASTKRA
ncbi:MAG: phytanoyl-CoA dioxygenase family protein [Bdellovibrionota bacterium]